MLTATEASRLPNPGSVRCGGGAFVGEIRLPQSSFGGFSDPLKVASNL